MTVKDEPKIEKPTPEQVVAYGGGSVTGMTNIPERNQAPLTDEEKDQRGFATTFRYAMVGALKAMEHLCGVVEQTTHGACVVNPPIHKVMEKVAVAYEKPSAYNVSEAAQYLRAFLNSTPWRS